MTRPLPKQCAILVGGLGTRLGALTVDLPKPLLPVGDRPFLAWLLRELCRWGFEEALLLTGHLSDRVRDALDGIASGLPRPMRLVVSEEKVRAGTGGALWHAREHLDSRFLLLNGDSLLDTNLAPHLAAEDPADASGRLVLRSIPDASRYGVVEMTGGRVQAFAERPEPGRPGLINAGLYVLRREIVEHLHPVCSLEAEVLPALATAGRLRGAAASGYFVDIGVPSDLARAREELPFRLRRPALFFDRDGVLNRDHGWVGSRDRWEWIPGAQEAVRLATEAGWHVFVITNQSGVARGHYTEADVGVLHGWMTGVLRNAGGNIDDVRYCPFHPEAAVPAYRRLSDWRKPGPGMLLDLLRAWELDPASCVMIGDQVSDMEAARRAGMTGHLFSGFNLADFVRPLLEMPRVRARETVL
jgi:D,D-heptose 1,7-bisphosphate phosphatase